MKKRILFALGLVWFATLVVGSFASEAYAEEGRPFTATSNLNVRSDPGYGAVVATVPAGSEGLIYGEPQTSYFIKWEYVVFDTGPQGWVATQHGKYARSYSKPFPSQCYAGTFPAPGSKGCFANADGHSYHCGGVTYQKPQTSPCSIDVPDTVYYNEPFTIRVTGDVGQSIGIGEWRGPLSPAMCPSTLTNCTGATCTMEATATSPGTLFVGFFTHRPAPGGINVYGPTCRKTIHAVVRTGTPPPPTTTLPPPPPPVTLPPPPISTPPPPAVTPPPSSILPPPPTGTSCPNNWNSTGGGYYQKPGDAACSCAYFDAQGRQTLGIPLPVSCKPVTAAPYIPEQGLNFSPQWFGSPQAGQITYSTEAGSNVYTGTDFPVGSEPRLVKTMGSGWLSCSPGQFMSRHGLLVTASGGNYTVFKINGQSERDGLFVWWRQSNGSYDWRRMTLEEYRAEDRFYDLPGQGNVPYAPNCVVNLTYGLTPPPPPPSVTPPPPAVELPPPPPTITPPPSSISESPISTVVKFEAGEPVRIKRHPTLGDIPVYYRNDPLPDGRCGSVIAEKNVGTTGTITEIVKVCGPGRYWKVRFDDGGEGWVIQNRLAPLATSLQGTDPNLANTLQGLRQSIENLQNALNNH